MVSNNQFDSVLLFDLLNLMLELKPYVKTYEKFISFVENTYIIFPFFFKFIYNKTV